MLMVFCPGVCQPNILSLPEDSWHNRGQRGVQAVPMSFILPRLEGLKGEISKSETSSNNPNQCFFKDKNIKTCLP